MSIKIRNLQLDGAVAKLVSASFEGYCDDVRVYMADGSEFEGSWVDGAFRPEGHSELSNESVRIITNAISARI